jgi:hypothetical protein
VNDWTAVQLAPDRAALLGVQDTPDGPIYPFVHLMPPEEWAAHQEQMQALRDEGGTAT